MNLPAFAAHCIIFCCCAHSLLGFKNGLLHCTSGNDDQGIDMSHYEAQPISSGWDYGENHDYHYMSYAPEQAFRSNFNLWRGSLDPELDWFHLLL